MDTWWSATVHRGMNPQVVWMGLDVGTYYTPIWTIWPSCYQEQQKLLHYLLHIAEYQPSLVNCSSCNTWSESHSSPGFLLISTIGSPKGQEARLTFEKSEVSSSSSRSTWKCNKMRNSNNDEYFVERLYFNKMHSKHLQRLIKEIKCISYLNVNQFSNFGNNFTSSWSNARVSSTFCPLKQSANSVSV